MFFHNSKLFWPQKSMLFVPSGSISRILTSFNNASPFPAHVSLSLPSRFCLVALTNLHRIYPNKAEQEGQELNKMQIFQRPLKRQVGLMRKPQKRDSLFHQKQTSTLLFIRLSDSQRKDCVNLVVNNCVCVMFISFD